MWHKCFLLCILSVIIKLSISARTRIGRDCELNGSYSEGVCTLVTECAVAINAIKQNRYHSYPRCGWRGDVEIICCPRATMKYGSIERRADKECKKIIKSSIGPINVNIIYGLEASIGEFPHMVALGYEVGGEYDFRCGGTLISSMFVLSAAHCFHNLDRVEPTIVRVGVVELGGNTWNDKTDYRISKKNIHPEYVRVLNYNDIALARLNGPVRLSTVVNPACLYTRDADPDAELIVSGWGRNKVKMNVKSNVLLKASVSAVDIGQCSPYYRTWKKLPRGIIPEQICAADPEGHRDACQGDSGGPLQMTVPGDPQYRVVGVISFGLGCSTSAPGVYTRVSRYIDWIEGIVWPN